MDAQEMERKSREAYQRGTLKEMEKTIRQRTLKKAEVITRSMRPEEKEEYLRSRSFQNALNQTRKKDRVYQAILSGELPGVKKGAAWYVEKEALRQAMGAPPVAVHGAEGIIELPLNKISF